MLLPYSSDVYAVRRPWVAYCMFPVFVGWIFMCYGTVMQSWDYFGFFIFFRWLPIREVTFLAFVIWSCFFMWTFSTALCGRIGNIRYLLYLAILLFIGAGIGASNGEYNDILIWYPSWIIDGILGVCLMFMPNNSVECCIVLPPWRSSTFTAIIIYISWLVIDAVISAIFGWNAALILHSSAFVFGFLSGWLLSATKLVKTDKDSYTFWGWIRGGNRSDAAWEDSWSVRKKQSPENNEDEILSANTRALRQSSAGGFERKAGTSNKIGIMCNCGEIIHVPADAAGKKVRCPSCSHIITVPQAEKNTT